MPIIDLEQGSQTWLDYRKSKIMATDSPIILGSNPWKTKLELWEEKLRLRPPVEMNQAMREGQLREPIARQLVIDMLGINFIPIVYESDTHSWLASSLDGISTCGEYMLELKCPTKEKLHNQALNGEIPEYYADQVQHQMKSKPDVKINFYCTYFPLNKQNPITCIEVKHNLERQEQILDKGEEFYNHMRTMNPPSEWRFTPK